VNSCQEPFFAAWGLKASRRPCIKSKEILEKVDAKHDKKILTATKTTITRMSIFSLHNRVGIGKQGARHRQR
jgi:hypothetical protein